MGMASGCAKRLRRRRLLPSFRASSHAFHTKSDETTIARKVRAEAAKTLHKYSMQGDKSIPERRGNLRVERTILPC